MLTRKLVPAALMVAALWGCSINGPTSTFEELGEDANTRGFGRLYPQDPNENAFVLGVGDQVVVTVAETPELTGTQAIRQDGKITLPLIHDVTAAGLTTEQLRKKIETRLAVFMRQPEVTVAVGLVVSKRFFVAAQNPLDGGSVISAMPYAGDTTIFDVFVAMGAPSNLLMDDCHVKLIRGDPRTPEVRTINVREMYTLGYTGANVQIRPDDIVYVPPTLLGHLNAFLAGVSIPFRSLFIVTRTIVELDYAKRVIEGDDAFVRGRVFF